MNTNFKDQQNREAAINACRIPRFIIFPDGGKCRVARKNRRTGNNRLDSPGTNCIMVGHIPNQPVHINTHYCRETALADVDRALKNARYGFTRRDIWSRDDFTLHYIGTVHKGAAAQGEATLTGEFSNGARVSITVRLGESGLSAFYKASEKYPTC